MISPASLAARAPRDAAFFDHNNAIARASSEKRIHIISSGVSCAARNCDEYVLIKSLYYIDIYTFLTMGLCMSGISAPCQACIPQRRGARSETRRRSLPLGLLDACEQRRIA